MCIHIEQPYISWSLLLLRGKIEHKFGKEEKLKEDFSNCEANETIQKF